MKKVMLACAFALAGTGALAQTSISIGINQPGVYGRINIGDVPRPALVYAQPVVITQPPVHIDRRPIYMYVPRLTRATGGAIAAATAPVASRCTSCRTSGCVSATSMSIRDGTVAEAAGVAMTIMVEATTGTTATTTDATEGTATRIESART